MKRRLDLRSTRKATVEPLRFAPASQAKRCIGRRARIGTLFAMSLWKHFASKRFYDKRLTRIDAEFLVYHFQVVKHGIAAKF